MMKNLTISLAACALVACSGAQPASNNEPAPNNVTSNNPTTNNPNNPAPASTYEGVVINELAAAGDPNDWVELYNSSSEEVDLSGALLSDSLADPMAGVAIADGTTIGAGAYLTLELGVGPYPFKLGGDEELGLFTPGGEVIDSVDWEEGASPQMGSYGRLPDGTGDFQTLWAPTRDGANMAGEAPTCGNGVLDEGEVCDGEVLGADTCATQGFVEGALGCAAGCATFDTAACVSDAPNPWAGLVINEIAAKGDPNDWIELYNDSDSALDIGGLELRDDGGSYVIPDGTTIEASGYLTFDADDVALPFKLGSDEQVSLHAPDGTQIDILDWNEGDSPDGGSFGRATDGADDLITFATPTRGAANGE